MLNFHTWVEEGFVKLLQDHSKDRNDDYVAAVVPRETPLKKVGFEGGFESRGWGLL